MSEFMQSVWEILYGLPRGVWTVGSIAAIGIAFFGLRADMKKRQHREETREERMAKLVEKARQELRGETNSET